MSDTYIDYPGILDKLKQILEDDLSIKDLSPKVCVEEDPQIGIMDVGRAIVILLSNRRPDPQQNASAGKRTRYLLRLSIWTVGFDMESYKKASEKRDVLLSRLESVLMKNRTIGGLVTASQLQGGDFLNARGADEQSFCALAETIFESEVSVINE